MLCLNNVDGILHNFPSIGISTHKSAPVMGWTVLQESRVGSYGPIFQSCLLPESV